MEGIETTTAGVAQLPVEREIYAERFAATFEPDSWDEGEGMVTCCFYDGSSVPRCDYRTGEQYDLTLSLDPGAVRLDRLNNGAPVCDNHDTYGSITSQLGVVRKAWIQNGKAYAQLQISPRTDLAGLRADIKAGIIRNVSMGASIFARNETTPTGVSRRQMTAVDWEPFEISFTMVPAVAGAVTMSAEIPPTQDDLAGAAAIAVPARATRPKESQTMAHQTETGNEARTEQNAAPAAVVELNASATAAPVVDIETARQQGVNQERMRVAEVTAALAPFRAQLGESWSQALIATGATKDQAGTAILERLRALDNRLPPTQPQNPAPTKPGGIRLGQDEDEMIRENMTAYLMFRENPGLNPIVNDRGREYVGLRLLDLARFCIERTGKSTRGMNVNDIAFNALTTTDLPNILANVANKTLRQGYQAVSRTFTAFSRQVTASDFKPVNRVQLSDLAALQPLNEKGEFHRTPISDSNQSYQLATFGEVVAVTRKVIINDDLQAITRIPFQLGVAAARLESDTVWAVFLSNQVMGEDNKALFHAAHNNLLTGAGSALGLTALATSRSKFRLQTGPKGTILNLEPSTLIVPTSLETAALQLIAPINLVATTTPAAVIPEWVRTLTPVVEPRLDANSTTAWYLATTPTLIDTVEYCYLEGQDGVYIETRQGFDVDGFEVKARLDFAAAAIDFRGLQKNAGA
jgi:hypothetical protein